MFSIVAVQIYILNNNVGRFPFLRTLTFIVFTSFNDGHSDQCEVLSPCSFDLHFFNN